MKQEDQSSTEPSDPQSEQSNPFSDPCFTDNTEEMLGRHIAIVGAPPPREVACEFCRADVPRIGHEHFSPLGDAFESQPPVAKKSLEILKYFG